ncbi:hypothetical protein F2P79_006272 [Pimephales promelas]|nr:hypothetical protein F2P79_006272 [Pimephales promelas]
MKSRQTFDKGFEKIWDASGEWAVVMRPCRIVYSIKCCLRAESPRDFADLLSWKHMPNVVIYDFARGLATHSNLRYPETLTFTPHEGCLADPKDGNIKIAKEGKLKISLPWLKVVLNINHQAVLAVSESSTQSGATDFRQVTNLSGSETNSMGTSADVNMEEVDENMTVEDAADEYSAQPWMKPHNLLQDKLVVVQ